MKKYSATSGVILALCGLFLVDSLVRLALQAPTEQSVRADTQDSVARVTFPGRAGSASAFAAYAPSGRKVTVTNAHVCSGQNEILLGNAHWERSIPVKVVEIDYAHDLCIAEGTEALKPLIITGRPGLELGEPVWVSGHPSGLPLVVWSGQAVALAVVEVQYPDAFCEGNKAANLTVSQVDTFFGPIAVCLGKMNGMYTTARIQPGNSGSPVLDSSGRVAGVVFAGSDAIGIIVPVEYLQDLLSLY